MTADLDRLPPRADLVVVGGGLAALAAALEARRRGMDVVLLCKGRVGKSGNSLVAAGNLSLRREALGDAAFAADILTAGRGLGDPPLVERFVAESAELPEFLESAGVRLVRRDGALVWKRIPGHGLPRSLATERDAYPRTIAGLSLTAPLCAAATTAGVRCVDSTPVVDLLVRCGEVVGAVAVPAGGVPTVLQTGNVLLATGGYAGLYGHTSNTGDTTGDGLALAYRAGARLRDLEFVQFHPLLARHPVRGILPTTLFDDGAVLRNQRGETFLHRATGQDDREAPRDTMCQAIAAEVAAGRGVGGGVLLDLSAVPESVGESHFKRLWQALRRRGCDPAHDPVLVTIAAHFSLGGVGVDATGATSIAGLYAAGEVCGGLHGANRLGGNGLTEALVLGRIAARTAAEADRAPPTGSAAARIWGAAEPDRERWVRRKLGRLLWQAAGVTRSAAGLEGGLAGLEEVSARFSRCPQTADRQTWSEAEGALVVARLAMQAALCREESRGAHARVDHPQSRPEWQGSLWVRRAPNRWEGAFRFVPASATENA